MYRAAYWILKDEMLAEDAVQDALTKIAEKFTEYDRRPGNNFDHLCMKIVQSKAKDILRRRKHMVLSWEGDLPEDSTEDDRGQGSEPGPLDYRIVSRGRIVESPESAYVRKEEHQELRQRMQAALATLSPKERDVLMLRKLHELSSKEVGEMLQMSEKSVNVMYHRIKKKLEKELERK